MIIQQEAQTHAYPYRTQKANSEGAWQAPKTLKHGLQRQYDKELFKNIYVQDYNLHWEQTNKRGVQVPSCTSCMEDVGGAAHCDLAQFE